MISFLCLFLLSVYSSNIRCTGKENTIPVYDSEPVFVKQTKNGKLYEVGDKTINSSWNIVHLYGDTEYEMGVALGELLKEDLTFFYAQYWENYIDMIIDTYAFIIPAKIRKLIEEYGPRYVLNLLYQESVPYTPKYFFDYMNGISKGSGVDFSKIVEFNYLPQLTGGGCSIIGAWGSSTPSGKMIQVRDFDLQWKKIGIIPLMKFPTFHVFHFPFGNSVVNINTAGFVGALSGYSSNKVCLSQKWYPTLETIDPFRKGFPWHFMLFDALRSTSDTNGFLEFIDSAKRTVSTYLGIGDGDKFVGVEMKIDNVKVFGWENQTTYKEHPKIPEVVYWDKEDFQPAKSYCLSDLLKAYHGNLTAENIVRYVNAVGETGDSMAIVYDFLDDYIYASYGLTTPAYLKQYIKLDMLKLFDEKLD